MNRYLTLAISLVLLMSGLLISAASAGAQPSIAAPNAPATAVGSGFTYQGQLKRNGSAVTDTCDIQFVLYDAASGGSALGTQDRSGVSVSNGLFTVSLDFGANAFTGQARWLEIAVKCAGDSALTTLMPRQALTAMPYALSLMPSATITGLLNLGNASFGSTTRQMLNLWGTQYGIGIQSYTQYYRVDLGAGYAWYQGGSHNDNSGNPGPGGKALMTLDGFGVLSVTNRIMGHTSQAGSQAVLGVAQSNATGIYGQANTGVGVIGESNTNHGVFGTATMSNTYGVYGLNSGSGYGVGGDGPFGGVYGRTANSSGGGVYGYNNGPFGNSAAGVVGFGLNSAGIVAISYYGNPIVAYGSNLNDRKFVVDQNGNVTADGTYSSPAADFAEMLPATDRLEPGDVLVIDSTGKLTRSTRAYQSSVVGVYSTKPAFVGGQASGASAQRQVPLAVVGIVPVKVTAENGAIHPGDLLVASSLPGHAMRAGDHPAVGTVIGKALGSLDKGAGVIQIVVMLQ